jgi:hypothetical protein
MITRICARTFSRTVQSMVMLLRTAFDQLLRDQPQRLVAEHLDTALSLTSSAS